MNEPQKQSVSLSIWTLVALTALLVAAVTALISVLILGNRDSNSNSSLVPETSPGTDQSTAYSSPEEPAPPSSSAAAYDSETQLKNLIGTIGNDTSYVISDGDCPPTALVVASGKLRMYEWQDSLWLETSFELFDNVDTPALEVEVGDYTPNSGHESFLVRFDGPAIGGPIFGGVLGQYDCRWSLVDFMVNGSIRKVVIGLDYSPDSGLTGFSTAGVEFPDLSFSYDPHNVAFFAD